MFEVPSLCSQLQAAYISGKECLVGLNAQMKLYINSKLFSNQCTSFHVAQTFLSFTNSTEGLSHELFNYDLNKRLPRPGVGPDGEVVASAGDLPIHPTLETEGNFNIRAVERGAKIVVVDPHIRTVLQMPRGNLEGIYPRIITLKRVIQDIRSLEFGRAFRLLRQHKIDINLLVDVHPEQFLANVALFLDQVHTVDHLNIFINSLVDSMRGTELNFMEPVDREQEIREEHEEFMKTKVEGQASTGSGDKVNKVCDAIKEELVKRNEGNKYLLPILTIYVKKQP